MTMRGLTLLLLLLIGCRAPERSHDLPRSFGDESQGLRPTDPASQFPHYDSSEQVESIVSPGGLYRVHFTRSGVDAVPLADTDGNGTPDFVDTVAATYDRVLAYYGQLGFRRPPDDTAVGSENGGDGLFDVYLLNFGGGADGAYRMDLCFTADLGCAGYMVQENDFAGYGYPSIEQAIEILSSHEMFHGVQAAYNPNEGSIAAEGTAVWATEHFNPTLTDFEGFVGGYLSRPDKTLTIDPVGPVQEFSYGAAIFFEFLSERFGDDVIRKLWEDCVPGARGVADPKWIPALDALLQRDYQSSFASAFTEFTRWNLFTGGRADPQRGYAQGSGYPGVAMDAKTFPADVSIRLALASARYFEAPVDGRTHVVAEWVTTDGSTPDMRTAVATVKSGKIQTLVTAEAGRVETDVGTADAVIFEVTNPSVEGSSGIGFLCAGTTDEIASCKAGHRGTDGTDAGTEEQSPATSAKKGGCASTVPTGWMALGVAWATFRRRRPSPAVP